MATTRQNGGKRPTSGMLSLPKTQAPPPVENTVEEKNDHGFMTAMATLYPSIRSLRKIDHSDILVAHVLDDSHQNTTIAQLSGFANSIGLLCRAKDNIVLIYDDANPYLPHSGEYRGQHEKNAKKYLKTLTKFYRIDYRALLNIIPYATSEETQKVTKCFDAHFYATLSSSHLPTNVALIPSTENDDLYSILPSPLSTYANESNNEQVETNDSGLDTESNEFNFLVESDFLAIDQLIQPSLDNGIDINTAELSPHLNSAANVESSAMVDNSFAPIPVVTPLQNTYLEFPHNAPISPFKTSLGLFAEKENINVTNFSFSPLTSYPTGRKAKEPRTPASNVSLNFQIPCTSPSALFSPSSLFPELRQTTSDSLHPPKKLFFGPSSSK